MTEHSFEGQGIALRFGELFLKGGNRFVFEQALENNVRHALRMRPEIEIIRKHGRIFVVGKCDDDLIRTLQSVFGIASLSKIWFAKKNIDDITRVALEIAKERDASVKSFRIAARRSDKSFPMISCEIGRHVGSAVAVDSGLAVDLTEPDLSVGVEVGTEWTFLWSKDLPGGGGLPMGTSGGALLLLSGGIDSPVAGHLMQKRGLKLHGVYFHAFPYTGDGAKDKVARLAEVLAKRQNSFHLHVVPFTKVQETFRDSADPRLLVVLYRRAMMRIGSLIAEKHKLKCLITGESLGQVASQTIENLGAIADAASFPVLRPLIGFDKHEIISIAHRIGTFDISILPHDDCCSLFVPRHPETHAKQKYVERAESRTDWQDAVEEAFQNIETIVLS
jgi:thiamine biosynthesis protein ThiI